MADTKTSALTALTAPAAADAFPIYDSSAADLKKILHSDLCISGTFTPTLMGFLVGGVQTYSVQTGNYTRIGNMVVFNIYLILTAKDGATSGDLIISGLPVSANGFTAVSAAFTSGWTLTAGTKISAYIRNASTDIVLLESDGATKSFLTEADFSGDETIMVAGSYIAA